MLDTGKRKNIYIDEKHLILTLINLYSNLYTLSKKNEEEINFSLFRDELYISICAFLIFTNLIYNGFNEDMNGDYSRLNKDEKRELESKLNIEMFKGFTFINKNIKGHDRSSKVTSLQDMKDVIKKLRDNIAHFSVKVKFSKNGNPEDHILLFGYEMSASIYYTISCKDLITFLMNPLFSEYKSHKDEIIELNNFDELKDIIIEKMKHN